jgi:hypothetical protein
MAAPVLAPEPIFAAIEAHRVAWGHLEDNPSKKKVHTTPNSKDGTTPSWMRHRPSTTILGATARLRQT